MKKDPVVREVDKILSEGVSGKVEYYFDFEVRGISRRAAVPPIYASSEEEAFQELHRRIEADEDYDWEEVGWEEDSADAPSSAVSSLEHK